MQQNFNLMTLEESQRKVVTPLSGASPSIEASLSVNVSKIICKGFTIIFLMLLICMMIVY